jgi:hypothetical protein
VAGWSCGLAIERSTFLRLLCGCRWRPATPSILHGCMTVSHVYVLDKQGLDPRS